jgi:hypothetical protein
MVRPTLNGLMADLVEPLLAVADDLAGFRDISDLGGRIGQT